MIVLNCYGVIKKTCLSDKLKLYIANLPEEKDNEWQTELSKELDHSSRIEKIMMNDSDSECQLLQNKNSLKQLYSKVFPSNCINSIGKDERDQLSSRMINMYFDYTYEDIPLGGWETNCFDSRCCEDDYIEKIINLMNFLDSSMKRSEFPSPVPQWIYSSNHDDSIQYNRVFWGGENISLYLKSLKSWGQLFDNMLLTPSDYYLFDYLCNALYSDNGYDAYHFVKLYSLCQMLLENERETELDSKLTQFMNKKSPTQKSEKQACMFRQIRNKIAHGDYKDYLNKIEEYATVFMDDHFDYDYSEYSRQNWVLSCLCCELQDILRNIIFLLFTNRNELDSIKWSS